MAGRHRALRHFHQAVERALQLLAIDAQVGGVAHALVEPGRALGERELPRPDVRLRVGGDDEALVLDALDRIRRRVLDPVDLARQQRRRAGVGLRHRQQHDAVDLRRALGIPVGLVGDVLDALARPRTCAILNGPEPEASAANAAQACLARSALSATEASASYFFCQCAGEAMNRLVRLIGRKLSGSLVVSSTVRSSIFLAETRFGMRDDGDADLVGREVRRVLVEHLLDVPDDGVGLEVRAVMELDAGAQLERPLGLVGIRPSIRWRGPGSARSPCRPTTDPSASARRTAECR